MIGGGGVDRLDGRAGDDVMAGGAGNDIYTVSDVGDVVVEDAGGVDVVVVDEDVTAKK